CAAPSAKGDDKFITTDYLQQCQRLTRQTLYRANRLFMEAYTEILELDSCFKD
ncbi:hypothetical protein OHK26_003648, partial [Salmonella enterica subsp. enterica serovar Infantis]|nr:hypothetical protein [Salmonella enterica subsp. enterica serovar Infantis]